MYEKSKKFHSDSIKNESARAKKLEGGALNAPAQPFLSILDFKLLAKDTHFALRVLCPADKPVPIFLKLTAHAYRKTSHSNKVFLTNSALEYCRVYRGLQAYRNQHWYNEDDISIIT